VLFFCFVLNSKNEIMLQQRAHQNTILRFFGLIPVAVIKGKGRVMSAGSRRLLEEMGFQRN
jgi:isopentenyldiphosphate isomerase